MRWRSMFLHVFQTNNQKADCILENGKFYSIAGVMKLVDMLDLGSSASRRGGSSPSTRTIKKAVCFQTAFLILFEQLRWWGDF